MRAERPERSGECRPSPGGPIVISSSDSGGEVAVGVAVSRITGFIGIAEMPLDRLPRHSLLQSALYLGVERV
jgi:hypothetical protein